VLKRVVLLASADQPLSEDDEGVVALCEAYNAPYMLVLTKADRLSPAALTLRMQAAQEWLSRRTALAYPALHAVSARTGAGVRPWFLSLAAAAGADTLPGLAGKAARRAAEGAAAQFVRERLEMARTDSQGTGQGTQSQLVVDSIPEEQSEDEDADKDEYEDEDSMCASVGENARLASSLRDPMLAEVAAM